ncbi:hypothetical protein BSSC8_15420 [Bacillus subtilis subsp. subtilis str. SC-8]|nr:hypothetical protein BSSC8_15420 [Bacillus subtilis subsp. subtilis str. SC-8]
MLIYFSLLKKSDSAQTIFQPAASILGNSLRYTYIQKGALYCNEEKTNNKSVACHMHN